MATVYGSKTLPSLTGPKNAPVKIFAFFGAVILSVFAVTVFRWVTSPYFAPSPVGTDPIPTSLLNLIRFTEVFCVGLIVVFLWILLIKPWIRDRKMPWDGMLMLALLTMWIQDPMCNYFNFTFMRSEEHTSELQSLMRTSYAVFCLKKKIRLTQTIYS